MTERPLKKTRNLIYKHRLRFFTDEYGDASPLPNDFSNLVNTPNTLNSSFTVTSPYIRHNSSPSPYIKHNSSPFAFQSKILDMLDGEEQEQEDNWSDGKASAMAVPVIPFCPFSPAVKKTQKAEPESESENESENVSETESKSAAIVSSSLISTEIRNLFDFEPCVYGKKEVKKEVKKELEEEIDDDDDDDASSNRGSQITSFCADLFRGCHDEQAAPVRITKLYSHSPSPCLIQSSPAHSPAPFNVLAPSPNNVFAPSPNSVSFAQDQTQNNTASPPNATPSPAFCSRGEMQRRKRLKIKRLLNTHTPFTPTKKCLTKPRTTRKMRDKGRLQHLDSVFGFRKRKFSNRAINFGYRNRNELVHSISLHTSATVLSPFTPHSQVKPCRKRSRQEVAVNSEPNLKRRKC